MLDHGTGPSRLWRGPRPISRASRLLSEGHHSGARATPVSHRVPPAGQSRARVRAEPSARPCLLLSIYLIPSPLCLISFAVLFAASWKVPFFTL